MNPSSSMLPCLKTNSSKLLIVRLDLLALRMSPCRAEHVLHSCKASEGGVVLHENFYRHLPVVLLHGVLLWAHCQLSKVLITPSCSSSCLLASGVSPKRGSVLFLLHHDWLEAVVGADIFLQSWLWLERKIQVVLLVQILCALCTKFWWWSPERTIGAHAPTSAY